MAEYLEYLTKKVAAKLKLASQAAGTEDMKDSVDASTYFHGASG